MKRRDFLTMASIVGLGASVSPQSLWSQTSRKVIVIGAGAAGLTAGYHLKKRGIGFQILEASGAPGGRMKRNLGFADFPIPLGAEWLHGSIADMERILGGTSVRNAIKTAGYSRDDVYGYWNGSSLDRAHLGGEADLKFVNSSWYDFFEQFVLPSVQEYVTYQHEVTAIDTTGEQANVRTRSGQEYAADAVIVTVPLKMLQEQRIAFTPPLPKQKANAINAATVWNGYKAFLEFNEKYYPAYTELEVLPETAGQHAFYDAAHGQASARHILGLFSVGQAAEPYSGRSEAAVTRQILEQLDQIFDGQATPRFRKIITQDWSQEPHIHSAYLQDHENWKRVRTLGESVGSNLHFAGEAYTIGDDWGSVHNAALSAKGVVDRL